MKKVILIVALNLVVTATVVGQSDTDGKTKQRWWISAGLAAVYETNFTHDEQAVGSFGLVPSFGVHFRDNAERPSFEAEYEIGLHRYTNTDEFDRVSQNLSAAYRKRLWRGFYSRTTTEASLKGSSEDREINNNYVMEQQLQYRFVTNTRVAVFAAYRLKRYPLLDRDSNSIDSYAGAKIEQRFVGDRRVEFTYKYDHNRAWNPRNNYIRRSYTVEFDTPLSLRRRDFLFTKFRYSPRDYQNRLTRVNGVREPRHDDRWMMELVYERALKSELTVSAAYQYEKRNSNDIDKRFSSNVFALRFTFNRQP